MDATERALLADTVGAALAADADPTAVLPPFGASSFDASHGLATSRVERAQEVVVVRDGEVLVAPVATITVEPVHGIDPAAGLCRVTVLDGLFGAADDLTVAIGRELLASGTVPTLIEL